MTLPKTINIGYLGEKMYRYVDIDISDVVDVASNATATVVHQRSGDTAPYPVAKLEKVSANVLRWTFSAVDTSVRGYGEAQVIMSKPDGTVVAKSKIVETVTGRSLGETSTVPEPFVPYVNQIATIKAEIQAISDHVDDVAESIDTSAEGIETAKAAAITAVGTAKSEAVTAVGTAKNSALSEIDDEVTEFKTWETSQFEDIATKVTEANTAKTGAETAKTGAESVLSTIQQKLASGEFKGEKGDTGTNGVDGQNGADGADGISPSVTVTDITGGHRVSITDADGTKTFDVPNGQNGSDASVTKTNVINALTGMTSSEQDNACAVLGAERARKWELIREFQGDGETTKLDINDELVNLYYCIYVDANVNIPIISINAYISTTTFDSSTRVLYHYIGSSNQSYKRKATGRCIKNANMYTCELSSYISNTNGVPIQRMYYNDVDDIITDDNIHSVQFSCKPFPIGCTIKVFGIRA